MIISLISFHFIFLYYFWSLVFFCCLIISSLHNLLLFKNAIVLILQSISNHFLFPGGHKQAPFIQLTQKVDTNCFLSNKAMVFHFFTLSFKEMLFRTHCLSTFFSPSQMSLSRIKNFFFLFLSSSFHPGCTEI